jgi:hypothetical protein
MDKNEGEEKICELNLKVFDQHFWRLSGLEARLP